jgi:ribosome-associated protein
MSTSSRPFGSTRKHSVPTREVAIETARIALGDFLKWAGAADTGGRAKQMVQTGAVRVNGAVERRRGRRLAPGDRVAADGREYLVVAG